MHRRRRALLVLLAAMAWLVGLVQGVAHEATTRHLVCPDHGELVEIRGEQPGAHAPEFVAAQLIEHADGCEHPVPPPTTPPVAPVTAPALAVSTPAEHPRAPPDAPTPSPLRNAPKTSPPIA